MQLNIKEDLFTYSGRISLKKLWTYVVYYLFVFFALGGLVMVFGENGVLKISDEHSVLSSFVFLAGFLLVILIAIAGFNLVIKRLHDRGKSGFFLFIMFLPVVGAIWLLVELYLLKGDINPNQYGLPQED
jgi:uncharacterized membrane protein YhaH (DUF805 family)